MYVTYMYVHVHIILLCIKYGSEHPWIYTFWIASNPQHTCTCMYMQQSWFTSLCVQTVHTCTCYMHRYMYVCVQIHNVHVHVTLLCIVSVATCTYMYVCLTGCYTCCLTAVFYIYTSCIDFLWAQVQAEDFLKYKYPLMYAYIVLCMYMYVYTYMYVCMCCT